MLFHPPLILSTHLMLLLLFPPFLELSILGHNQCCFVLPSVFPIPKLKEKFSLTRKGTKREPPVVLTSSPHKNTLLEQQRINNSNKPTAKGGVKSDGNRDKDNKRSSSARVSGVNAIDIEDAECL